jgi:Choline/Carnitine o-acyltransferase
VLVNSIETRLVPEQKELPHQPFTSPETIYREVFRAVMINADLRNDSANAALYNFAMGTLPTAIMWGHRFAIGDPTIGQIRRNEEILLRRTLSETEPPAEPVIEEYVEEALQAEYPKVTRLRAFVDRVKHMIKFGRTAEQPVPDNINSYGWEAKLAGEDMLAKNFGEKLTDDPLARTPERRAAKLIHATTGLYTRLSNPETAEATVREINDKKTLDPNWFKKVFAARVPEKNSDIKQENNSDYILVTGGTPEGDRWMYRVQVIRDAAIPAEELEETIKDITEREKSEVELRSGLLRRNAGGRKRRDQTYAALTYMPRRELYKVTEKLVQDPTNKASLDIYRGALFSVSLIDGAFESNADAMQYGAMAFRKDNEGKITDTALHTPNDLGLTLVIDSKGSCIGKAEHLNGDGSPHELLLEKANGIAIDSEFDTMRRGSHATAERVDWNIDERTVAKAEKSFAEYAKDRKVDFLEVEGAGADEFGKQHVDAKMQMATQIAHFMTRLKLLTDKGKGKVPLTRDVLDFYSVEPISMTHYKNGRVANVQVKTKEMQALMREMLENPQNENLGELIQAAMTSIQTEVVKGKGGNAFLSQLMAITAANFSGNPIHAAFYMRVMERIFVSLNPRIKKLFRAELLASNGVRSDQVPHLDGFTTVEPLAKDGITVGYIPGINGEKSKFYIRTSGEFTEYGDYYKEQLQRSLELLKKYS